jgi:hypothetical protein
MIPAPSPAPGSAAIVIRGSGVTHAASRWLCGGGFILLILVLAKAGWRDDAGALAAIGLMSCLALAFIYTETLRVELNGDEIAYRHAFRERWSLRRDEIKSARGVTSHNSHRFYKHYLLIEPVDPKIPTIKIRTDFFSHADVNTIRNFLGGKLKR